MSDSTGMNTLELGQTMPGTDSSGNLINGQFLGTIKKFTANRLLNAASGVKPIASYGPIYAVVLRNASGGALLPKRLAKCYQVKGYGLIEKVSGYTTALYDAPCVAIDPYLPDAGVAANDLFLGIFRGPTILTTPTASGSIVASATVGLPLVASADSLGRPTPAAPGSAAAAYQAAWATYRQALRDVTAQDGFPWTITWPAQPE